MRKIDEWKEEKKGSIISFFFSSNNIARLKMIM